MYSKLTDGLFTTEHLRDGQKLPLLIRAMQSHRDLGQLVSCLREKVQFMEAQLLEHGALLFRDFPITSVADFKYFAEATCKTLMEYSERSSPRTQVFDNVYTSTDYPAGQRIFPHNEHSDATIFPLHLLFCCLTPSTHGGATPLVDIRRVTCRISSQVRDRFEKKKWMYVRNFGDGLGLTWQNAFQTSDKLLVEKHCRERNIELEWKQRDQLRTRQVRPAFIHHPITGEKLWFNHITFFHISTLESTLRDVLTEEFADEDLPNNTYYGDGSAIENSVLEELRSAYEQEMVRFEWQKGDVLLLDNVMTAHAREAFSGPRKVVVAMADPVTRDDLHPPSATPL